MKKLLTVLSIILILVTILLVPNQAVSAEVTVIEVGVTGTIVGGLPCAKDWTEGGVTHLRNCVVYVSYTSSDPRLTGSSTLIMNRNIFAKNGSFLARGHGSWDLHPIGVEDGYWAGTFTANIDKTGYMTVNIRGKGYGVLVGLLFENTTHGIGGEDLVLITTLPSYDGP